MATKKSTGATTKPATGKTTKKSVRPKKTTTAAKTVRAKKPTTAKKPASPAKAKTSAAIKVVSSEERSHLIAVAAYLRSETRGFPQGGEVEDWLLAEQEVDLQLTHP